MKVKRIIVIIECGAIHFEMFEGDNTVKKTQLKRSEIQMLFEWCKDYSSIYDAIKFFVIRFFAVDTPESVEFVGFSGLIAYLKDVQNDLSLIENK